MSSVANNISKKSLAIIFSNDEMCYRVRTLENNEIKESEVVHYKVDELNRNKSIVEIKHEMLTNEVFNQHYDYIHICFFSTSVNLVPNKYLTEPFNKYLSLYDPSSVHLTMDSPIILTDASLVYQVPEAIKDIFLALKPTNYFDNAQLYHSGKVFLDSIAASSPYELHLNFALNNLEVALFIERELELYNLFNTKSDEDILFYVIYIIQQFKIDQEKIKVILYGEVDEMDNILVLLKKYISNITFYNDGKNQNNSYYTLNKLFECELYQEI